MKHLYSFVFALVALVAANVVQAQGPNQINPNCVGLKNPTNFTLSGTHDELWTGYTGNKNYVASTCSWEGSTYNQTVQASNLETYNNTNGCTIGLETNARTTSKDLYNNLDHSRQFVIKGEGTDPETHGHLSYLPPDTSFHTSIRLGNYCGNSGAEKLTYQIAVRPDNAFITLWYALSLQNGQHSAENNPEFVVVVEKNIGTTAAPNWVPLAGDTLCHIRPTPANANGDTAFRVGATGTVLSSGSSSGLGYNIYLPWHKLTIDLSPWMYQTVRIRISMGDCSFSAHYGLAYIAGDCQSKNLWVAGCVPGDNVTVISAPEGAESYEWYRSKTGLLMGSARDDTSNYVLINGATSKDLDVTEDHLVSVVTGDTMTQQTFMCKMTSRMNSATAVVSKSYTDIGNTKPRVVVDSSRQGNTIHFTDRSFTPYAPGDTYNVDTSQTQWEFFNSAQPHPNTLIAAFTGGSVHYTLADSANLSMRMRVFNFDASCSSEKDFTLVSGYTDGDTTTPAPPFQVTRGSDMPAGVTPESLVASMFLGGGVEVSNVMFNGSASVDCNSIGSFTNNDAVTHIGMESGIILATGDVVEAMGPNNAAGGPSQSDCSVYANAALSALAGTSVYDIATLEFDFVPKSDSVSFRYMFASEEYPEYINSTFSDIMGAFLTGMNPNGGSYSNTNIAVVPQTNTIVGVVTVNSNTNASYFKANNANYIQYDGYTTVLTAKAKVVPCQQYHLSIAVGDVMDPNISSAILLDAGSFYSNAIEFAFNSATDNGNALQIYEGDEVTCTMTRKTPSSTPVAISFEVSGDATPGLDCEAINTLYLFPASQTFASKNIRSYFDGISDGPETLKIVLSPQNGCPRADSVEIVILDQTAPCDTLYIFDTVWLSAETYNLVVTSDNPDLGLAAGNGHFPAGTAVEIAAIPIEGNRFVSWNDGLESNPRTVIVNGDTAFYAMFTTSGIEEVPVVNGWSLKGERGELVVEGAAGRMVRIFDVWGRLLWSADKAQPEVHFAVPASGSYVVQVDNGPAKKITVLRK